jgi:hypothetical protein
MLFYHIFFLIPILNALELKTKICANCKFFIPKTPLTKSKCFLFPKVMKDIECQKKISLIDYLVTGIKTEEFKYKDSYFYCSTARLYESMCGIEGTKFISIEK